MLALALATGRRRSLGRTRLTAVLCCIVLVSLALGASGCGGTTSYSTPTGTSSVTVTFSGTGLLGSNIAPAPNPPNYPNGNPNIVNSTTFSLTVQ
jgi:hypothetical protein